MTEDSTDGKDNSSKVSERITHKSVRREPVVEHKSQCDEEEWHDQDKTESVSAREVVAEVDFNSIVDSDESSNDSRLTRLETVDTSINVD